MTACATVDHGHGRLEERRLIVSTALVGDRDGPGLAQGFQVERRITITKSGVQRDEVVSGLTSLSPDRVRTEGWVHLVRQHWQIESQVHWVRDGTFDEERSHVRCGSIPQGMAAFRQTVRGVRRWTGERHIAAAYRRFAAQPWSALALIGIRPEN